METTAIDELEPSPYEKALHTDRRDVGSALNTDHVAIVRYVLEPGERFSGAVHAHADQEEVFVVLTGTVTFDVELPADDAPGTDSIESNGETGRMSRELTVSANEAIRFAPGEFQSGRNDGDEPVVALALGAPRETEDVRVSRIPVLGDRDVSCPDCGHDSLRFPSGGDDDPDDPDDPDDQDDPDTADAADAGDAEPAALECPVCGATSIVQ